MLLYKVIYLFNKCIFQLRNHLSLNKNSNVSYLVYNGTTFTNIVQKIYKNYIFILHHPYIFTKIITLSFKAKNLGIHLGFRKNITLQVSLYCACIPTIGMVAHFGIFFFTFATTIVISSFI